MRMQLPDGEMATTNAENASVFGPHFHRVFNNHRPIDWTVFKDIKQREVTGKLYKPILCDEIKKSTTKFKNDKAPGLNYVPPNAFKEIDDANLSYILLLYNQFWHSQAELDEWHEGQVVLVPKKGDKTDPNRWKGVTLMDIGSNIYSRIICG